MLVHQCGGERVSGTDRVLHLDVEVVNRQRQVRHKMRLEHEACRIGIGGLRLQVRVATDLAIGSEAAVGNVTTRLSGEVEFRFGWGVPMGFTKIPDPPGIGMVLDPVYLDPEQPLTDLYRWRIYFNLVGRYNWITYLVAAEGGPTENGGDHPALGSYPGEKEVLFGLHLTRVPFSVHLTYCVFLTLTLSHHVH